MYVYFTTIKKDTQNDANYFTRINTLMNTSGKVGRREGLPNMV